MNKENNQWQLLVLLLKEIATEKSITQEMIARRTGLIQSNISRIFALKYRPTLDTYMKLAEALEVNVEVVDKEDKVNMDACFFRAKTTLENETV